MWTLNVKKSFLLSTIEIPPSKSYANRALILASLRAGPVRLTNLPTASDVTNLLKSLKEIGLQLTEIPNGVVIENSFPDCETKGATIDVGEGGTTARFLACLLLLGKSSYRLRLGERLSQRPWKEFIELGRKLGAKIELSDRDLIIQGPIKLTGELEVDCSKTTQFATGLQLLSIRNSLKVAPQNMQSSQSYWKMTENMISYFHLNNTYEVPKDWSSASYPIAFGAHNQTIFFPGLHYDECQADAKLFTLLKEFECIKEEVNGVTVFKSHKLKEVVMDVSDCLDLVPTLGYFLSHVEGSHRLKGIKNLIHKESDRLSEVIRLLKSFKRSAYIDGEDLIIEGDSSIITEEIHLKMPDDHRMVMVATLFLLHHSGGSVSPAESVKKSWPEFFKIIFF